MNFETRAALWVLRGKPTEYGSAVLVQLKATYIWEVK